MVLEVPLPRESVSGNAALTAVVMAKEGLVAMSVEPMSLALMSKKAGSR